MSDFELPGTWEEADLSGGWADTDGEARVRICLNDTNGDGNCAACARNPKASCRVAVPAVDDRYVKRDAPDKGRVVTVTRVWKAGDGHTAVAYDWTDDKPGRCGSACPLDVFHRTYQTEGASESAREALIRSVYSKLSQNQMEKLVDAYAHELAEQQRTFADQEDAHLETTSAAVYVQGVRDGADLIDPEVSSDG
ncbi:hypothetical protein [Streptomyces achromogenes]|uniref:hypothetical protein n=1 Tax=Streptomyces achromogenes TaxID=67255 RepID=UPI0036CEFDF7